ncbi:hypothetical protein LTR36_003377 [Oleoguttula mirabilis]|uniref:Uncharacterized protein n=1 Tax=Oleoguttula mirabilis TaxID=1507867 RepID=A0AAV9JIT6_9PEZI|nr:hypothetical protein LTR36_003377 [Oleoguttula mirabilis]
MLTNEGFHARHHAPHRPKNFPPQVYADLGKKDIALLASVFAAAPARNSSAYAAFERMTLQLITELPPHLRSKISFLTALCSQHKKLNPLPIISLWNAIRREVDSELATIWSRVGLTPAQSHFITRAMQHPWYSQSSKCAACSLSQLAADVDLVIAVGAITLATLSPRNWKRSKRVFFLQSLLIGRAQADHAAGAIQKMCELGSQFRQLRVGVKSNMSNGPRLDGSATETSSHTPQSPPRPSRLAAQNDHMAVTFTALCHDTEADRMRGDAHQSTATGEPQATRASPSGFTIHRKPVPGSARGNVFEHAFNKSDEREQSSPASDAASSVYSVGAASIAAQSTPLAEHDGGDESEIIDLYRHSKSPESHEEAAVGKVQSTTSAKLPPLRRKDSGLVKYPKSKLAPISIPRNHYGGEGALRTSVLWKRRARAPQLRVAKNGEVKGPFDSVSDLDEGADIWI